jgi:hypothetical protein
MPKDRAEAQDQYKIGGGSINEYEFDRSKGEMEEQERQTPEDAHSEGLHGAAEPNAPQNVAERIRQVEERAHEIVERRRAKQSGGVSQQATKKAAKKATKKAAKKTTGKAAKKSAKKSPAKAGGASGKGGAKATGARAGASKKAGATKAAKKGAVKKGAAKKGMAKKGAAKKSGGSRK